MSKNQNHGVVFEGIIKKECGINEEISHTEVFDIPVPLDLVNTSIKTMKRDNIGLGDAVRIHSYDTDIKFIVGKYVQEGDVKKIIEIIDVFYSKEDWDKVKGNCTIEQIKEYRDAIKEYKEGEHKEARKYCKAQKKMLKETTTSLIKLNPKVDSKKQRRLQCSIGINDLIENSSSHEVYKEQYKSLPLPIIIQSSSREFNKREENE